MLNTSLAPDTRAMLDARGGFNGGTGLGLYGGTPSASPTGIGGSIRSGSAGLSGKSPTFRAAGENSCMGRSNVSEDDALSSVSSKQQESRPSVIGLRDRLLREARNERQRCLDVAEAAERRRAELRGICHAETQTDTVFIMDGSSPVDSALGASLHHGAGGMGKGTAPNAWGNLDEAAQTEALRTIQMLGAFGSQTRASDSRVGQMEAELHAERAGRQELESQLAHERNRKDAAQQQVLCLEYELDGKEAALQVAERALERRDTDLQQAQMHLRGLQQDGPNALNSSVSSAVGDARLNAIRTQLSEREHQLEQKDQHIARLLNVLRQHNRTGVPEEDSTVCGSSEKSISMSSIAANGYGLRT